MNKEMKIDRAVYLVDDNAKTYSFLRRNHEWKKLDAKASSQNKEQINGYTRIFRNGNRKVSSLREAEVEKAPTDIRYENLRLIPGVGPSIAKDLTSIGIRSVEDLKGKDPEKLYQQLCHRVGKPVDRCMLYVFRCAVYFAEKKRPKSELLKWWNWKDRK